MERLPLAQTRLGMGRFSRPQPAPQAAEPTQAAQAALVEAGRLALTVVLVVVAALAPPQAALAALVVAATLSRRPQDRRLRRHIHKDYVDRYAGGRQAEPG